MSTVRRTGLLALLLLASACDSDNVECTANLVFGLDVTVSGGGALGVCQVTVTARDGTFVEDLDCTARAETCHCTGVAERAGSYLVEVTSEGEVIDSQEVVIKADECHVLPQQLTFTLP